MIVLDPQLAQETEKSLRQGRFYRVGMGCWIQGSKIGGGMIGRILLADDALHIRTIFSKILTNAGHFVKAIDNGDDLFQSVLDLQPDLGGISHAGRISFRAGGYSQTSTRDSGLGNVVYE